VEKKTPNGTFSYFYDKSTVIAETDGNGKIIKSYNPGISWKDNQGNKFFGIYNGHGDEVGLMDVWQTLVETFVYDAFGKTIGVHSDPNSYRYACQYGSFSDDDDGLEYMGHRWYDPNSGRFISRDPIGFRGGIYLYRYCSNNPLILIDPNGTFPLFLIPLIIGAVVGSIEGLIIAKNISGGDAIAAFMGFVFGTIIGAATQGMGWLMADDAMSLAFCSSVCMAMSTVITGSILCAGWGVGNDSWNYMFSFIMPTFLVAYSIETAIFMTGIIDYPTMMNEIWNSVSPYIDDVSISGNEISISGHIPREYVKNFFDSVSSGIQSFQNAEQVFENGFQTTVNAIQNGVQKAGNFLKFIQSLLPGK
jgi:RHS repeat-associated protein